MVAYENQSFFIPWDGTAYIYAKLAESFKKPEVKSEDGGYKPNNESMPRIVEIFGQLVDGPSGYEQTKHEDRKE